MDEVTQEEKDEFERIWHKMARNSPLVPLLMPVAEPTFGIWTGVGWLSTPDGYMFHSWSANAMQAVIKRDGRLGLRIRQIGSDGLLVEEEAAVTL